MVYYQIQIRDAKAHLFSVTIDIPVLEGHQTPLRLTLPAWLPGSYMIRDFAKNINVLKAHQGDHAIPIKAIDKQTWEIIPQSSERIIVSYEVYAFDLSVRSAYLDQYWGFFNPSNLCLAVLPYADQPCQLTLPPYRHWQVATGMPRIDGTAFNAGVFQANNYDEFIDYPVIMGELTIEQFAVRNIPHVFVLVGRHYADVKRICRDLTAICEQHIDLFDGQVPFHEYVFLTIVVGQGFGGLEHRNSTALMCSRHDLISANQTVVDKYYRTFLSLCSHEYFHSWNIKTLKPKAFIPYRLAREQYTEQLWFYEGVTSYFDDYLLHRAGLIDADTYLALLGDTIARVKRGIGLHKQTVTESSFHAWTKFYKQDENAPNSIVSYYAKGALIALCLDLILRLRSDHHITLARVMNDLWLNYGKNLEGTADDTVMTFIRAKYDIDISDFLQQALYTTNPLPLRELLAKFGVSITPVLSADDNQYGGRKAEHPAPVALGAKYKATPHGLELHHVFQGEAAHLAGLSAHDRIIAIDYLQANDVSIKDILQRSEPGDEVIVHAFRRDELLELKLTWQAAQPTSYTLTINAPEAVRDWLLLPKSVPPRAPDLNANGAN